MTMRYRLLGDPRRPLRWKSLSDFLFGIRTGFGESGETLRIASRAALRSRRNWFLPGLLGFLVLIINMALLYDGVTAVYVIARVVLVDYLVFVFGWLCGWSAASKWRNDREFLEELIVTNQRPTVIGNLLTSGYMPVWLSVFGVIAVVEIFWSTFTTIISLNLLGKSVEHWVFYIVSTWVPMTISYVLLVWFHLETIRISYWMFTIPSLNQVNLRAKAVTNLLAIFLYVGILTFIGAVTTTILGLLPAIIISATKHDNSFALSMYVFGAIPALMLVSSLKRHIVDLYELAFSRTYLLYCWFGAGEMVHPIFYPANLNQQVQPWLNFISEEEAVIAVKAMDQGKGAG